MSVCTDFCLSISRDHTVEVSKAFVPDARRGKGGTCVLTERADCGPMGTPSPIDADNPVKTYTSPEEFAAEWDSSCPVYTDVLATFAQTPRPPSVDVVFYDGTGDTTDALLAILECLGSCYNVLMPDLKDDPRVIDAAILFDPISTHQLTINTCDPAVLDASDPGHTASIGYILRQLGLDVNVNYQDATALSGTDESLAGAVSGYQSTQQFDTGSGYALWYAQLNGISPAQITTSQADTLDSLRINYVSCVSSGANQINLYKSGILQSGVFADSRHKCCWLQARLSEAQFTDALEQVALTGGPALYDEECYINTIDVYDEVLLDAVDRQLITGDRFSNDVDRARGYQIVFPDFNDISAGDFASRTLPCGFGVSFDSGRIQETCFNFQVRN